MYLYIYCLIKFHHKIFPMASVPYTLFRFFRLRLFFLLLWNCIIFFIVILCAIETICNLKVICSNIFEYILINQRMIVKPCHKNCDLITKRQLLILFINVAFIRHSIYFILFGFNFQMQLQVSVWMVCIK